MGLSCRSCNGMGWGHLEDGALIETNEPCTVCNPKGKGAFLPARREKRATVEWQDAVGSSSADDLGQSAEAVGFHPSAVKASGGGKKLSR